MCVVFVVRAVAGCVVVVGLTLPFVTLEGRWVEAPLFTGTATLEVEGGLDFFLMGDGFEDEVGTWVTFDSFGGDGDGDGMDVD